MAEIKTEQEPSIEEILESIRQIISEDGTPVDAATAAAKPAKPAESIAAPVPPKPKQIEAPKPVAPPAPAPRPEPILDLTERVEPVKPPRIVLEETPEEEQVADDSEHLVSDDTADAAVASLAKLLANNMSVERELPGRPGNVTLEDMTREILKPLLRQWLDQNLQHIIEKMVAREIERLSLRALEK